MNSFCIIGLGKFGTSLAGALVANGKQVMVIDNDPEKVTLIADSVTNAVIGDATNVNLLKASGVADYDCAIVCITTNINANILLTIMLKDLGVKKVVSRACNEGHKRVLEKIGADMIVFPEQEMGEKLGYMLTKNNVTDFVEFSGYDIVEIEIPEDWIGKSLIALDLRRRYNVNVIALSLPDGTVNVSPDPTRAFVKGDRVSVIGSEKDVDRLIKQVN